MKLAEALVSRGDLAKRLEQVKARLLRNAKVQEGDEPAEDPHALLGEHDRLALEFEQLIGRINRTNSSTALGDGTLTDALAARDVLRLRQATYRDLAEEATVTQTINTRSEIRFRSAIDVAVIQKKADDLSQALRQIDLKIQEMNWQTEILN